MAQSQEVQPDLYQAPRLPWRGRALLWLGLIMLFGPLFGWLVVAIPALRILDQPALIRAAVLSPWFGLVLMYATARYFQGRSARRPDERDYARP